MSDKKALTRLAKHLLFEFNDKDVVDRFTLYDRPGPQINNLEATAGKDVESTIGREVPLKPSVLMATQNFGERPPVEDEDYLPSNRKELGNAASVISSMVPPDQIEFFYKGLHDLYDAAQDREGSVDSEEDDSDETQVNNKIAKKEEEMKKPKSVAKNEITKEGRRIISLLRELVLEASSADLERLQRLQSLKSDASADSSRLDAGYLAPDYEEAARRLQQKLGLSITAADLAANAPSASPPTAGSKRSKDAPQGRMIGDKYKYGKEGENWRAGAPAIDPRKSLEYMKNVLDYASESGARQAAIIIKRRFDRIMALLNDPDASAALDDLLDVVKDDLFDVMVKRKQVTPKTANAYKKNPEKFGLYQHPSFKNLMGKILDPLHKQEEKAIQDTIRLSVSKISVNSPTLKKSISVAKTGPVSDTVFNQIVGGSDPDFDNIKKRLMQKDNLNEADATALTEKIKKSFLKIRKDVGLDTEAEDEDFAGEDILSAALDDWMKKSEKDKEKIILSVSDALKADIETSNREKAYIEKIGKGSSPQNSSVDSSATDDRDESIRSSGPAYVPPAPGSAPESSWARGLRRDRERIEAAIAGRKVTKAREEEELAKRRAEYEAKGGTTPTKPRGRGRPPKAATVPATTVPPAAPVSAIDRVAPTRRKKS